MRDQLLAGDDRQRRIFGYVARQLARRVERLTRLHEAIQQAMNLGILCRELAPRQRKLHRQVVRQAARQAQQSASSGHQAALDLGQTESRRPRGHNQIACERDLEAAVRFREAG